MLRESDAYQVARMMIDRHGEQAIVAAARRADEAIAVEDQADYANWRRIIRAIGELQRRRRRKGERLN